MIKNRIDFICIGAPKAGTTWLYDNLKEHSDIWIPPYKSFQYFSGLADPVRKKKLRRFGFKNILVDGKINLFWKYKYFFSNPINDQWYLDLFKAGNGKIKGEISPSYTTLTAEQVEHAYNLAPNAKIIFFMRNPIERCWSHFKLIYLKNADKSIDDYSEKFIKNYIKSSDQEFRSDYIRTYENWSKYYSLDNIYIDFFDRISDDPDGLLKDLCEFLGVNYKNEFFIETSRRNIFKGVEQKMPQSIKKLLLDKYTNSINELHNKFQSEFTRKWIKGAEAQ